MIRILILGWGKDGKSFIGKTIAVYNDHKVKWAGSAVGGMRISKMSHIKLDLRVMLTESRGRRPSYTVRKIETVVKKAISEKDLADLGGFLDSAETMADLQAIRKTLTSQNYDDTSLSKIGKLYDIAKSRVIGG